MSGFLIAAIVIILWRPVAMLLGCSVSLMYVMTFQAWRLVRWLAGN